MKVIFGANYRNELPESLREKDKQPAPGLPSIARSGKATLAVTNVLWPLLLASILFVTSCSWLGQRVGDFLEPIGQQIDAVIAKAQAAGDDLLLTAAGQADLAMSNVESALADDLNKAINSLDDASRRSLDKIAAIAADLSSDSATLVQSTIDGSQQLINSIPFTNKNPQVRDFTPHVSSSAATTAMEVTVSGNFVYASDKNLAPELIVAGTTYKASGILTSQLTFLVPEAQFKKAPESISHIEMELTIPYESGVIFKSIKPGVFHLLVTILPLYPLKSLTLETSQVIKGTSQNKITQPAGASTTGGGWRVQSWSSCKVRDDSHVISATNGWQIVPSSIVVDYSSRGTESRGRASVTNAQVTGFVVTGHTEPNCDKLHIASWDSGDITYFVTYTEEKSVDIAQNATINVLEPPYRMLNWGDSAVFPVPRGGWSVAGELWDGTRIATAHEDASNRFVKVKDDGDSITVRVIAPEELVSVS